jgi:hypothetical protein
MYLPASQGAGFLFHQSQLNAFVTFAATLSGDVITYLEPLKGSSYSLTLNLSTA